MNASQIDVLEELISQPDSRFGNGLHRFKMVMTVASIGLTFLVGIFRFVSVSLPHQLENFDLILLAVVWAASILLAIFANGVSERHFASRAEKLGVSRATASRFWRTYDWD